MINNVDIKSNTLYKLISSFEIDIRNEILSRNLKFDFLKDKCVQRITKDKDLSDEMFYQDSELIEYLDLSDYKQIFAESKNILSCDKKTFSNFQILLDTITPIRNRVMHSRPLHDGDYDFVINTFNNIESFTNIINFDKLKKIKIDKEKNPNSFLEIVKSTEKIYIEKKIIHNLPITDFQDTGFVGRSKDKENIKKKIFGPYPVITIIGDGGIGKTSTLLSCLYDIVETEESIFDRIIWVTLKTKSLQDGEFKEIKNHFKDFFSSIDKLEFDEKFSNIDSLQKYMVKYKVLLIIDNLETINTNEIKDFLENLQIGSKVIITSRIGIGEFENRYKLDGLSDVDATSYFRKLVNFYNVKSLSKITDIKIKEYVNKLFNSPLCIKWFIINVGKGGDKDIVLNSQDSLVEFCLSNVYDKLSKNAIEILTILMFKIEPTYPAEIIYLSELSYKDCLESINELSACNFLENDGNSKYHINDFAKKYLNFKVTDENKNIFEKKINKLKGNLENLYVDVHLKDRNRPLSFFPKNDSEKISTIYMLDFIDASKKHDLDRMDELFEAANNAAPGFADIYKVAGYLYAIANKNIKANECYEIALSCENNKENKAYIKNFYAGFLINKNIHLDKVLKMLNECEVDLPNNHFIPLNIARYYKFVKDFQSSKNTLNNVLESIDYKIDLHGYKVIYYNLLDILYREIDMKNYNKQSTNVENENIIYFIDNIDPKYYSIQFYKVLYNVMKNIFYDKNLKEEQKVTFIRKYLKYIFVVKDVVKNFPVFIEKIEDFLDLNKINTLVDVEEIIENIELGRVIKKADTYGFISFDKNSYSNGIYFNEKNFIGIFENINVGTEVSYNPAILNGKLHAINVSPILYNNELDLIQCNLDEELEL